MRISDWSSDVCSSDLWRVDPALAFAHALQESNFQTAAVSPANARGLMQITPITVRQHAARLEMDASYVNLDDPQVNLAFGQRHLDRKSDGSGTSVSVRVESGGRRLMKTTNEKT